MINYAKRPDLWAHDQAQLAEDQARESELLRLSEELMQVFARLQLSIVVFIGYDWVQPCKDHGYYMLLWPLSLL